MHTQLKHNTLPLNLFFLFFIKLILSLNTLKYSLKKMSSSSFESSEWYDSSSDETERRIRVIRERRELNNALSRELLAYAEGQSSGQGRRWRGPDQVRDREAATELLMRDYFTDPCNYNDDIF